MLFFNSQPIDKMDKSDLLSQLKGKSITQGYGVVVSISESYLNSLLAEKYHSQESWGLLYQFKLKRSPFPGTTFDLDAFVGPPRIFFDLSIQNYGWIEMDIEFGKLVEEWYDKSGSLQHKTLDLKGKSYKLRAEFELGKVEGEINDLQGVEVHFKPSTFQARLTGEIKKDKALADMVALYVNEHLSKQSYVLGVIWSPRQWIRPALMPKRFQFTTGKDSDSGAFLTLWIETEGDEKPETVLDMHAPIIPAGHSTAMYVSSRIVYKDLLMPLLYSPGATPLSAQALGGKGTAWFLYGSNVPVEKTFPGRNMPSLTAMANFNYIEFTGNRLTIQYPLEVRYTSEAFGLQYQNLPLPPGYALQSVFTDAEFKISPDQQDVSMVTHAKGGTEADPLPNYWNLVELLHDQVLQDFEQVLIHGITLFADSNLLNPDSKALKFQEGHLPGDLLLLGIDSTQTHNQ